MFRLRLFGGVALEGPSGPATGRVVQRRRLGLLALVAGAPDGVISRDKLIAYLWPELETSRARHLLSDALYVLNKALAPGALVAAGDDVRLNPRLVWADVRSFQELLARGALAQAVELYRGPFLDGFFVGGSGDFEEWAEAKRQEYDREFRKAVETLACAAEAATDFPGAARWWERLARHDPYDAALALRVLRAQAAAGDAQGALRSDRARRELIRREFGAEPEDEATAFARELRSTVPAAPPAEPAPEPAGAVGAAARANEPPGVTPVRPRWRRPALAGAALLATLLAVVPLAHERPPVGARRIVLAPLIGSDATLALAIREALRAELEARPEIRVLGEGQLQETMRLMLLPEDTLVTPAIALEIARRRGLPLAISGSVLPLGRQLQIVVQLLDARTETSLRTLVARPAGEEEVIPAIARLGAGLRAQVLDVPEERLTPLPAVTTRSLEALRGYALARQQIGRLQWDSALAQLEAGLVHDSLFALAHYHVADLHWWKDRQRRSEHHLSKAYELRHRLPPRERLVIQARYEHLVRDRPDSALAYWELLARSFPEEPLAFEGLRWAHRSLGDWPAMAAASEAAYQQDSSALMPYFYDRTQILLARGDTAGAFDFARSMAGRYPFAVAHARYHWALQRQDWPAALQFSDGVESYAWPFRHIALLGAGRIAEAARLLEQMRAALEESSMQYLPRALLLQARLEPALGGSLEYARELNRAALEWTRNADLSAAACARLSERIADAAARAGDPATIAAVRRLIFEKDGGRALPSFRLALLTVEASAAFARGDMRAAAELASQAWPGMFLGRSVATVVLLEADARAALGERHSADSLYRAVLTRGAFVDGEPETLAVLQALTRRYLTRAAQ
ncbi:MAG: hypothetical protein HY703_07670 [Gemmatimonadetes bacterium]|nr:hypothetical protein [Gemmatimonadota bacterium]